MPTNTKEYMHAWRAKNRQKYNSYFDKYRQDPLFRKKNIARCTLNRAIKRGSVVRGDCTIKKCTGFAEAHHPDYDKPLDVIWLCKKHHELLHENRLAL